MKNNGLWAVQASPWAISVMKGVGVAVIPQEPAQPHNQALQPVRAMALWAYTDLRDPRFLLGKRYLRLRSDPGRHTPQKLGVSNRQGWVAYHRARTLFVKRVAFDPTANYPDMGSNVEVFTNAGFIEVETLGPLQAIEPGGHAEHVEAWHLFRNVADAAADEAWAREIEPLVAKTVIKE